MSEEIVLKLSLPGTAVPALRRHPLFAEAPLIGLRHTLVNTYFDTPELELKEHCVALRTRKQGRQWLQTIKSGGALTGGLAQRSEWEQPYHGTFDFSQVDALRVKSLLERHAARLQPLFTTQLHRETRRYRPREGVEILLMLDQGTVEAAGRNQPLCELELQLNSGGEADLFQLALLLTADLPFLPEDLSKAQRGYHLFLDQPLAPVKARPSPLQASDSPVAAYRRLSLDGLHQWQANANGAMASDDPEFIHQIRVALRRLRSLLRIMAPALSQEFVAEWNARLRDEAAQLGSARDLDVLLETILAPAETTAEPPPGLAQLRLKAEATRTGARARADATLAHGSHGRSQLAFTAALHRLSSNTLDRSVDLATFARLQLKRLKKRVRRRLMELNEHPGQEGLHELRIALKQLRYGLEFFLPLCTRRPTQRLLRQLAEVQDDLGFLHDLVESRCHFLEWADDDLALREAAAFVAGWHARRAQRLTIELPERAARLLRGRLPLRPLQASP
jgi:inorganic triphosphatase YgiF